MLRKLWKDEAGFVISAELVLVLTIAVLAMIVGLSEVAIAVNTELNDISNAIGALDQSYYVTGFEGNDMKGCGKDKSSTAGSRWTDSADDGDGNDTCDLVGGAPQYDTAG